MARKYYLKQYKTKQKPNHIVNSMVLKSTTSMKSMKYILSSYSQIIISFSLLILAVVIPTFTHMLGWKVPLVQENFYEDAPVKQPEQMFANASCSPSCCPSQFMCSGGCVCLNDEEKNFVSTRGYNSSQDSEF
jgi:hypothetical protein